MNMYSLSETRPKVREEIISRDQLLDHFDDQFEEHKILCVSGEEGVGVTTTLALFAQRHGDECASYFNNGWSRHLLNPQTIMSSLLQQLSHYAGVKLEQEDDKKNLTPIIFKLSKRTKKNNLYFVFDGFAKIPNEYVDSIKAVLAPLFNIENARFLFSGEKEDIVQLLPEALNVKRVNEVLKFQQNDVEGYLKKVVPQLDEEAIDIIYKLSHKGEARRLAILMEKLEKEGIEKIRSYYMNEVDDFYEEDYKWIEDQHDEHITLLMTLLAYSEIPLDKVSVMQTLKLTQDETDKLIERCNDYIEEEDGLVGLRSDDYRKYLRVKLADFKTSVELMLIEMIEKSSDVDNKFLYLPALYKHVKDKESLVNYLTSDNVQRYLEEKKSQAALNEQCEYGYNACTNFDTQAAAFFRFAINRSVSREIEKNELMIIYERLKTSADEVVKFIERHHDDMPFYSDTEGLLREMITFLRQNEKGLFREEGYYEVLGRVSEAYRKVSGLGNVEDGLLSEYEEDVKKSLGYITANIKLFAPNEQERLFDIIINRVLLKNSDGLDTCIGYLWYYLNKRYVSTDNERLTDGLIRILDRYEKSDMQECNMDLVMTARYMGKMATILSGKGFKSKGIDYWKRFKRTSRFYSNFD